MVELILRSDSVVTPDGVDACDIAIAAGRILCVAPFGSLDGTSSARLIDLTGRIVMPGGIDPHVNCDWPMPMADGPLRRSQPASVVSRAAVYGGTTTLIDCVRLTEGSAVSDAIGRRQERWDGACHTDYAFHLLVEGSASPPLLEQLGEALRAGHASVKVFTTDITPSRRGRKVDLGSIWELFQVVAANKGLMVVHAEDDDIVMHMYEKLLQEGRVGFENMAEVHNGLSEDLAFRRLIRLAECVPGTALYLVNVSAATGVAAIREARSKGLAIYGESLPHYLLFTSEDYRKRNGQLLHTFPSLKSEKDQAALWAGTLDGSITCIATDEICCTLAEKMQGTRIDDLAGGHVGVEPRLALMYTEMVGRRGYTLRRFVDLVSTNAARVMGLYPRKGAIAEGADADICVLDPTRRRAIRSEDLHEADHTAWHGWEAQAWPCLTILRGKVVMQEGELTGDLTDGTWIPRRIPEDIIAAPQL
ncbi:Amidohydrolase family protein [Rhodovastum atsumiense]|uniref:Amidohydrolase family protein n=1 Tax=Rhodovastum atsumiense TaxID=504468 RepID=A0A5M6J0Z6_9PROT|nr:amidohydrolase family protein [Rhodovastum atsumiense]KAA5614252.1 amidohydrolase family protein [Rhodovastum atsumiense]CAH2604702.1 Amidohydrolase family protein [Rhodovastum atsumiense]